MSDFPTRTPEDRGPQGGGINTNSFISFGLLVVVVGGIWALANALASSRETAASNFSEVKSMIDAQSAKTEAEIIEVKTGYKDRWTGTDMFKWAVHLQRDNPSIKVPEP